MRIGWMYITPEENPTGINRLIKGTCSQILEQDQNNDYYSIDNNYLKLPVKEPFGLDLKFNHTRRPLGEFQLSYEMSQLFDMRDYCSGGMNIIHSYFRPFITLRNRCPKILTVYDLIPSIHPEWAAGKEFYDTLLRASAEQADQVIAISEYTKSDLINYYNIKENKIQVIYPGLDSRLDFKNTDKSLLASYPCDDGYILSICSLAHHKNMPGIIKGFTIFKQMNPKSKIKLFLVGQPIPGNELDEYIIASGSVKEDIIITGYVDDRTLSALYKYAIGIIYLSFYEGFGLPVLEAMAAGKPVISSNTTSMPEVGGDAVMYCNPYKNEEIAETIELMVQNEQKRLDCEKKGLERAKMFSYKKAAQETLELYRKFT